MHDRETSVDSLALPWRLFGGLLLVSVILGALFGLRPLSLTFADHLLDALAVLYALFLALVCFHGSWRLVRMPRRLTGRRFIPALLGMTTVWTAFVLLGWVSETALAQQAPTYPSPVRVLFFGIYPFFIAAVLLLPSSNLSRLSRLRMLLDSLIIMATVATLYSYLILVPILITTRGTLLAKMIGSLFTAADLVLLFCLLFVALQAVRVGVRQVIMLLTLAALIILIGHVISLSFLLSTQWSLMIRANSGVLVSLTLIAVAAYMMRRMLRQEACAERGPMVLLEETGLSASWKTILIAALVLIFALLLVSLAIQPLNRYTNARLQIVEIGGTGILMLLVLRQFFAMHEVNVLKRDLREKNAQLELLATMDPLTGVFNRRTLLEKLDRVLGRAQATHRACSLLFIDIDHFKAINDQYGHQMGDVVLRQVAESVTSLLRPDDCLGRWGGDEFVAVLPGEGLGEGRTVAETIRRLIAEQQFTAAEGTLRVTCSLGVATSLHPTTERERLIACADQALYRAKRLGRNQVCAAQEREESGAQPCPKGI